MIMRLNAAMRRQLETRERGSASLEGVGMYVVAAVLVLAMVLAAASSSPQIGDLFRQAVCRVVTLGQGPCETAPSAEDHKPTEPCVVNADGYNKAAEGTVIVTVGGSEQFLVEKLSNGKFRLTRGTGGKFGKSFGEGAGFSVTRNGTTYGVGTRAGVGLSLTFAKGEVYYADNPARLKELLEAHTRGRTFGDTGTPTRGVVDFAEGLFGRQHPTLPAADESFLEAGAGVDFSAQTNNMKNNVRADLGAQAVLGLRRATNGNSTTYFRAKVDGSINASIWAGSPFGSRAISAKAKLDGKLEGLVEVDRDSKNNITAVRYKTIVAGRAEGSASIGPKDISKELGHYEEQVTNLPIRDVADQQVAQRYLNALGLGLMTGFNGLPAGSHSYLPIINPVDALGATQAFSKAAEDHGTIRRQHFDDTGKTELGADGDVDFHGINLGAAGKIDSVQRESTGSDYYNGHGAWVPEEGCAAK